ncbi:MAG: SCP2 sterol-binding domain-containing protein [Myxococcota bacterium]
MPKLTEADILFELFVPMLCESRAAAMKHWKGLVQFYLRVPEGEEPRVWHLSGGEKPWLKRGPSAKTPDVKVTVTQDLVEQLIRGEEPDLVQAGREGRLGVQGSLKVLESLELTLDDAKGIVGTLMKRNR